MEQSQQTPGDRGDSVFYYATPLEQCYSLYVVQQVFHVAPNMPLYIAGRSAVPFLTQSGVNRKTLRSIWAAVDPQNTGSLTQLTQFQLMLRLVSMAQFGILEVEGTPESMREAVQQHAGKLLALAVFQSVVIPPHENLLAMYGMFVIQYQAQPEMAALGGGMGFGMFGPGIGNASSFGATSITSTVSVDDAFSDLGPTANAPLPSLEEVISTSLPPPSTGSVADGSTTTGSQAGVSAPAPVTDTEEDEFGDFEEVTTNSAAVPDSASSMGAPPVTGVSDDPLGSFGAATNQPLPGLGGPSSAMDNSSNQTTTVDHFGGFAAAPGAPDQLGSMGHLQTPMAAPSFDGSVQSSMTDPTPQGMDNLVGAPQFSQVQDEFGGFEAATAFPATQQSAPMQDQYGGFEASVQPPAPMSSTFVDVLQSAQDDFGGFNAAPSRDTFGTFGQAPGHMASPSFDGSFLSSTMMHSATNSNDLGSTTPGSISDAFGAIGVQDAPLPPRNLLGATPNNLVGNGIVQSTSTNDDDEDFGGFETATVPSNDGVSTMPDSASNDDPFAGVPGISNQALPQWDASAPSDSGATGMPSLDQSAAITNQGSQHEDEDDDFGGFETAADQGPTSGGSGGDQFGTFGQAPTSAPSFDGSVGTGEHFMGGSPAAAPSSTAMDDPFGELTIQDAPLTPLGQFTSGHDVSASSTLGHQQEDVAFGGFEDAPSMPRTDAIEKLADQTAIDEHFAGMQSVLNQPTLELPPSPSIGDDFGSFEDAPAQKEAPQFHAQIHGIPGSLAFGGSATAREVSVLSQGSGFAASPAAGGDNDDPFTAFDTISAPVQPGLPPLSATFSSDGGPSQIAPAVSEDDEDFTDFASSSPAAPDALAAEPGDGEGNVFGDFEAVSTVLPVPAGTGDPMSSNIATTADSSLPATAEGWGSTNSADVPSAPVQSGEMDDDFGDFGSAAPVPAKPEVPPNDWLGSFDAAPSQPATAQAEGVAFGAFGESQHPREQSTSFGSDNFGAFDSAQVLSGNSITTSSSPSEDLFDTFGATTSQPVASPNQQSGDTSGTFNSSPALAVSTPRGDLFGVFETAPVQPTTIPPSDKVDDFGSFGSPPQLQVAPTEDHVDDDWGDFGSAPVGEDVFVELPGQSPPGHDFGAFAGQTQQAEETAVPTIKPQTQDFATFGSGTAGLENGRVEQAVNDAPLAPLDQPSSVETEDEWGDFGTASTDGVPKSTGEHFGAFDSSLTVESGSVISKDSPGRGVPDGNWGTFTAFSEDGPATEEKGDHSSTFNSTSAPKGSPQAENETSHDDWGDFGDASVSSTSTSIAHQFQNQIRGLSVPLSETLLRKTGFPGGHVDLVECFEVNIGLNSPMDLERKARVDRCIQILEILSKMGHNDSSSYWERVLKAINEDFAQGLQVLIEAKGMAPAEISEVSQLLLVMVSGFKEYLRVARSIVASIGDLLLLDLNAWLTIDTMASTWWSLSILDCALEIESKWKDILNECKSLPTLSRVAEVHDAPSLTEIRSESLAHFQRGDLCDLTLQPLRAKNKETTKARVAWNGRHFMACSANLLANRCPFYVTGTSS